MPRKLTPLGPVTFAGTLADPENVSGAAFAGDFLLLVCDQTAQVDVLRRNGDEYVIGEPVKVGKAKAELDLEAVAAEGNTVYAIGSHSLVRAKLRPDDDYATARKRMTIVKDRTRSRDILVRFTLTPDGKAEGRIERSSLRPLIAANPVLAPFAAIPSKENGIDIEGLAARAGRLYVGFRGPVLRGNFVPVLVTRFGKAKGKTLFVNLGGLGVRDLAATSDGFLIVAGPLGEGGEPFRLFRWNGRDCLPGADPAGECDYLCDLPSGDKVKPEGLAVTREDEHGYEFLLVSDGVHNGNPTLYRVEK